MITNSPSGLPAQPFHPQCKLLDLHAIESRARALLQANQKQAAVSLMVSVAQVLSYPGKATMEIIPACQCEKCRAEGAGKEQPL